jgi:hypothetical protein
VSPVKYELSFYILEDGILHSHRLENLKSYRLLKRYYSPKRESIPHILKEIEASLPC